jgi:hypothetical protein
MHTYAVYVDLSYFLRIEKSRIFSDVFEYYDIPAHSEY